MNCRELVSSAPIARQVEFRLNCPVLSVKNLTAMQTKNNKATTGRKIVSQQITYPGIAPISTLSTWIRLEDKARKLSQASCSSVRTTWWQTRPDWTRSKKFCSSLVSHVRWKLRKKNDLIIAIRTMEIRPIETTKLIWLWIHRVLQSMTTVRMQP